MHPAGERSTGYAIAAPTVTTVAVAGRDEVFPVARVFCVGRNYAEHAIEMGHDPEREPPFFFMKPADAVVPAGRLPFPTQTQDLHHEVELVVALGEGGREIPAEHALDHVFGYAVGLDMTRRDMQAVAKNAGRPWDMAKGFDQSAPTGEIRAAEEIGHPTRGAVWLRINGELRQEGDLDQQIWKVPETISYLSTLVALRPGDLIMTGTPKGIGRVEPGDRLEGHIDGVGDVTVTYDGCASVRPEPRRYGPDPVANRAVAVGGCAARRPGPATEPGTTSVVIPRLIRADVEQAVAEVRYLGMISVVVDRDDRPIFDGGRERPGCRVFEQDPRPATEVVVGDLTVTVTLTVGC